MFQDGWNLEGEARKRHSEQEEDGKPEQDKWKRYLSCSLLDPTLRRGLLGIVNYINIPAYNFS